MPEVTLELRRRALLLGQQLQAEIEGALRELAEHARDAFIRSSTGEGSQEAQLQQTMGELQAALWLEQTLLPILYNHSARVAMDVRRILGIQLGQEFVVTDTLLHRMNQIAGEYWTMAKIGPQVEESVLRAIRFGWEHGLRPGAIGEAIKQWVPEGRFTHAGVRYRADLIARNETANLQRAAALVLYAQDPRISRVEVIDGIYGPPRSDRECLARDGEIIPLFEAELVFPYHPLCSLGFEPVL